MDVVPLGHRCEVVSVGDETQGSKRGPLHVTGKYAVVRPVWTSAPRTGYRSTAAGAPAADAGSVML